MEFLGESLTKAFEALAYPVGALGFMAAATEQVGADIVVYKGHHD